MSAVAWTALVGLAGIGATLLGAWWGEHKIDSRRKEDAERQARRAFRVAKRLVVEELETVEMHLAMMIEHGPPTEDEAEQAMLPATSWEAHKQTLALELSNELWSALAPTVHATASLRSVLRGKTRATLNARENKHMKDHLSLVESVRGQLAAAEPYGD